MTYALIPNFSIPLPVSRKPVPIHADPILAAIDDHSEAWAVFMAAPVGPASERAAEALHDSLDALLATPCASRCGAEVLLGHLRRVIREQAIHSGSSLYADHLVLTREHDLSLLVGSDLPPTRLGLATPFGRFPCGPLRLIQNRRVIEDGPAAAPALVRVCSTLFSAGEVVASLSLIAGGSVLVGLATLV